MDPYNNFHDFVYLYHGRRVGKTSIHAMILENMLKEEYSIGPEADTYTLIPNGTEITKKQGHQGKEIPAYLVQHDQTGQTIKWEGASPIWYEMGNYSTDFRTFSGWSKKKREKWYANQYNRILTEEKNNMYDDDLNDLYPCTTQAPAFKALSLGTNIGYIGDSIHMAPKAKYQYPKKETTKMNISTAAISNPVPTDQRQRDYLLNRLSEIRYTKEDEFHTIFHLDPVKGPKTWNALVQAIKDGDFTIDEKYAEKEQYYTGDILNYVRWSKTKPDQEGYKAACKALSEAYETAKDEIVISEPKDGLKVLEAFKAKTFH